MAIKEVSAKSVLIKRPAIDSWFLSRYGMNLYRGCSHNCSYCDGRAESYYVEGDFAKDIEVKVNAPELLDKALNPARKRKPLRKTYLSIGGGVSDSYQPLEKKYEITRKILKVINRYDFPVYILTKSSLIERDIDLLKEIQSHHQVLISMSFSSVSDEISGVFEPGCTPPSRRLETLKKLRDSGIATGVFLMPVIPGITDKYEHIRNSMKAFKDAGVSFVLFGGMTLKDGRQKLHYYKTISNYDPTLISGYDQIYPGHKYGSALTKYYLKITRFYNETAKEFAIPRRVPARFYEDIFDENDLVAVILQNLDYLHMIDGIDSEYKYASHTIARLNKPLSQMMNNLSSLKGVGKSSENIIREIIETGKCVCFDSMV